MMFGLNRGGTATRSLRKLEIRWVVYLSTALQPRSERKWDSSKCSSLYQRNSLRWLEPRPSRIFFTTCFSCIGCKLEFDNVDTRRYNVGADNDTLHTGANRECISSLRVHSCVVPEAFERPAPLELPSRQRPAVRVRGRPEHLPEHRGGVHAIDHNHRSSTQHCIRNRIGRRTDICG
jgi:hypothetical protein